MQDKRKSVSEPVEYEIRYVTHQHTGQPVPVRVPKGAVRDAGSGQVLR